MSSYWSIVARNVLSVARNPLRSVSSTKEIVYDLLYVGIVLMFTLDSPPTYREQLLNRSLIRTFVEILVLKSIV